MANKPTYEKLEQMLNRLQTGDHLCCIYQTDEEHRDLLTPFMRQGLERNEKVVYIVDSRTAEQVINYLKDDGLLLDPYLQSGQLAILSVDEAYMREGIFDPDRMIDLLNNEMNFALDEGYSALRVTGEMSWALKGQPGSERLIEYEAKLNNFFPGSKCLAICQYDRRKFDPALLLDVLATHPIAVVGTEVFDNFYFVPVKDFLAPDVDAAKLKNRLKNLVERQRELDSINYLNDVLGTIREVNQLIVREKDRDRLLHSVCNSLISTRGYQSAWIALFDEFRKFVKAFEAGLSEDFLPMIDDLKHGKLPDCVQRALAQPDAAMIEDSLNACTGCLLADKHTSRRGMSCRLEYNGNLYGVLTISIPRVFLSNKEEQSLFTEVANDIAYALYGLELEEDRKQAEEALQKSERELKIRERISRILLTVPDDKMYEEVLQVILAASGSKYGVFGYIDDKGAWVCPSMTRDVWDQCKVADKDIMFSREKWGGIWGRALIEKKTYYSNTPFRVPEGHVPIHNALAVPVVQAEELIGLLLVGNKEGDYDENDKNILESISNYIAPVLHARLQSNILEGKQKEAEKKIRVYYRNLEREVEKQTRVLRRALYDTEEARDKIDGILKSVGDGMIVTDIHNRIVLMNRAAEDILDIRLSEVINRPIDFAIKDKTLLEKLKNILNKKKLGIQFDFEIPANNKKRPRIIRARTSLIQDKIGDLTGIITILFDVTLQHEVDRLKTEFISIAAHELRTPLTSIRGFSEILLIRDDIKEEEKKKFLSYINKQSLNLTNIVDTLLDISRIESGRGLSLNKAPCDINEIIRETVSYYQISSQKHQYDIVLPEGSVELMVDREKMRQVLENILSNATKYAVDGGLIRVAGELSRDHYQVTIEDQGIGMSPDQVEKMFDEFYRSDTSDKAIPGSGLGLSIVKNLVEAHGGKIWAESEPGKGTTVKFIIPI